MRSMQRKVKFGYRLSVCCMTEETIGSLYIRVTVHRNRFLFNLLKPNDIYIYIYIYIYMSYRSANLQTLHFKYLFNKYTY